MHAAVLFEPNLAAASHTPPFAELVKQLGLTGFWRTTKYIPDVCRELGLPCIGLLGLMRREGWRLWAH